MRPMVRLMLLTLLATLALPAMARDFDRGAAVSPRLGAPLRDAGPAAGGLALTDDAPGDRDSGIDIGSIEETGVGESDAGVADVFGESGEPFAGEDDPGDCRREMRLRAFRVVSAALELSETQREQWRGLIEDLQREAAPRRAALAEIRSRIAELTGEPDPDPAAIGELMLEARRLREELHRLEQRYREDFAALLDVDQRERAAFIAQAARIEPVLPAFRATHLLPAPHPRRPR